MARRDPYRYLTALARPAVDEAEAFDAHVFACVLSLAKLEAMAGRASVCSATGLGLTDLHGLAARYFPGLPSAFFGAPEAVEMDEEEDMLHRFLLAHVPPGDPAGAVLARIVARRAMRDDHLWQDLGLRARPELTRLLGMHFPVLAAGNVNNMKWKKYFYRKLCEAEGFVLCTAPSCRECSDFSDCFGTEEGMSRLAQVRNGRPMVPRDAMRTREGVSPERRRT